MTNSQSIRDHSLSWLAGRGFGVAQWLPLSGGDFDYLRPLEEIVARALALKALFAWAAVPEEFVAGDAVTQFLDSNNLRAALTDKERAIITQERTAARAAYQDTIGWKLENIWPLAWVMGFAEQPAIEADVIAPAIQSELLHRFLPPFESSLREFQAELSPRPVDEVRALEDLFYCAHNAVRSAQLGSNTVPNGFHPILHGGVVHERRHALTWCLSPGIEWEQTDLST